MKSHSQSQFKIGSYTFENPWILAPMAGVSEMPFRVMALRAGASAAPTELVSAKGLIYGQARTQQYLTHAPEEQPFWVQLFGGDAESMAEGAEKAVELGAKIIDINMGCPVRKVTRNGAGSALLCDPLRARAIVESIRRRARVPVTAKIRTGWDHDSINALEMVHALADGGCEAVAVHGRTRAQAYKGKADWALIGELAANAPLPIIGNGDLVTAEDARRAMRESGCAAVMIGRGALGNPWLFRELASGRPHVVTATERWLWVKAHFEAHRAFVGDDLRAVKRFRPHLGWYAHGLRGAAAYRREVMTLEVVEHVLERSEAFFSGADKDAPASKESFLEAICDTKGALG